MKILLVTPHFYPENFKANDMAFELQKRGYQVTVLTPIPDYPQGHYYKGYGIFKRRREIINGVKVLRTFVTPRRDGTAKWLMLNYLTYTAFVTLRSLWHGLWHKYDAILVHEVSPVMVGIPAVIIKKMRRAPMYFWVLDLWPESLEAAGGIHNRFIIRLFHSLTKWIYKNSDRILVSSKGFRKSINSMGDFDSRIEYFPNWIDNKIALNAHVESFDLPIGFNVVFAGNIGEAQDIPHILDAAEQLRGTNINFVLVGDGRKREWALREVEIRKLNNVKLPGRFPIEAMPGIFAKADILFLSLKDDPIFALTVPYKLQAYMYAGKPIVAMINGEVGDIILEAECGWSVPAEDSVALACLLKQLAHEQFSVLNLKGENGRRYALANFQLHDCIDKLCNIISK